ncbi:MAG: CapA family protein [Anaerolineales bacterium]|nr:CapA family protein [Anaerolineales bacterium]
MILSLDGLRPDALTPERTPNILALARRGAYTFQAQTIYPPVTLPAHVSMLTGLPPEVHGVDWNDYQPARGVITATTLFTLAHAAGLRTVLIAGKEKFAHFADPAAVDVYRFVDAGDQAVVDEAVAQIAAGFDLLFVHLPNPDYFGHLTGWMSDLYLFQLTRTDAAVGRLLSALPAEAVVILTADHGGHGLVHGRPIPEDLTIPWIIAGPGVPANHALAGPVSVMDTAATAAALLGLTLPPGAAGRPVTEALNPPAGQAGAAPPITRLLFTGDINPGRCPAQVALANNDFTLPYQAVAADLRAADLTVGSLDGALSDLSAPSPCPRTKNLIGPSRTVEGLAFAGFDVITVATNHAKDCGALGFGCDNRSFLDTLRHLQAAGLLAVGGGPDLAAARAPAVVERNGVRFAFLGVTEVGADTWAGAAQPGTAPLSAENLPAVLADIEAARAQAEVVIVLAQWGVEYAETPTADQREWARQMAAAGAALIVGNHPHVVQPLERFPAGASGAASLAAYALGNFVFDQGPWRTRQGAVLEADFVGAQLLSWRLRPVHIEDLHQPRWAEPAEVETILARMPLLP